MMQTLQEHMARRHDRKSLQDAGAAINDFIRSRVTPRSTPDGRESRRAGEELRSLTASMDQGSRGGTPPPQPQGNDKANAALRAAFRHEPIDEEPEVGRTEA